MIERARDRVLYDELAAVAEIMSWCEVHPATYDLVVAADVFIYFGDLDAAFRRVSMSLTPGGLFAASFERHTGRGRRLAGHGRWAHGLGTVRTAVAEAGLEWAGYGNTTLRWEAGAPVDGYIALAQRSA